MSLTKIQKGVLLGLISAIFYGMQPIFSVYLQDMGLSNESILFYRNFFGALPLAIIMIIQKTSFRLTLAELVTLTYLAFLSDGSALFQLQGFDKSAGSIPTGVATTVRFVYPILTALIMMIFYKEKCGKATLMALFMAVAGVGMLSWPSESVVVKPLGVIFELLSALCYAFYVVRLNHSRVSNMAKDFGVKSKTILDILLDFFFLLRAQLILEPPENDMMCHCMCCLCVRLVSCAYRQMYKKSACLVFPVRLFNIFENGYGIG